MKPKNRLLPLVLASVGFCLTFAQAETLYFDKLDGNDEGLDGSEPEITQDGVAWLSSGVFHRDGSVDVTDLQRIASLPFVPYADNAYRFSAELDPGTVHSDWLALAFTRSYGLSAVTSNAPTGMILMRGDRDQSVSSEAFQAFSDGTNNAISYSPSSPLSEPVEVAIVLDTFSTNWQLTWYVDGVEIGNHSFTGSSPNDINYISIATNRMNGSIKNVKLENISLLDEDGDGLPDYWEQKIIDADPNDEIHTIWDVDPYDDFDDDGLSNIEEYYLGTDPTNPDSDGDGLDDGQEILLGTDPFNPDTDGDGLSDGEEVALGTDPLNPDSDGDGWDDRLEVLVYGTDPNDWDDYPQTWELINAERRNGSFEWLDGVPNGAKAAHWDNSPNGDIDNWTVWAEESTAESDSGAEVGSATNGQKRAFLQSGNAVHNMTTYKGSAGDILFLSYDRVNAGNLEAHFVIDATDVGLGIIKLPTSSMQVSNAIGAYQHWFVIPSGSLAIGRPVGVAFKNSAGGWPALDNVVFSVQDRDLDNDGLSDFAENYYWGARDDNPTAADLAITSGDDDWDGDGFTNAEEIAGGSDPTDANSWPNDMDGDGLPDEWEVYYFGNLDQGPNDDPDGDFATNQMEYDSDSEPDSAMSWPDTDNDGLNDGWEMHYFGNLSQGANDDPDGDGFTNLEEMLAGSDPTDADSTPVAPKLAHRWNFNGNLEGLRR